MKERPIIFSAPMVRALLEGRKTQTRRVAARPLPYGEGDRLWVKEVWSADAVHDALRPGEIPEGAPIAYAADGALTGRKRSVLFMPRWASRITLDIARVREEALQSISEGDARAEGVPDAGAYRRLWDSINAARGFGWEANPRVRVVEFRVHSKPALRSAVHP